MKVNINYRDWFANCGGPQIQFHSHRVQLSPDSKKPYRRLPERLHCNIIVLLRVS